MVKTFILNIFLVLAVSPAMAQNSISGIVTDKNEVPIPFANIILLQKGNESYVKGAVSDDNGVYFFEEIAEGTYQIEVSVLGFKIKKTEAFELVENTVFDFTLEEEPKVWTKLL